MRANSVAACLAVCVALAGCLGGGKGLTPVRTPFNKGVYLQGVGDLEGARAEYLEALEEDPRDHRARFNLALVHERLAVDAEPTERERELAAARLAYEQILAQRPEDLRAMVNLAAWLDDHGSADERTEALALLERAIEQHPDAALPRAALAARLLDRDPDAIERPEALLRRALRAERLDPAANQLLAVLLVRRGDTDEARRLLERPLARDPSDLGALRGLIEVELAADRPTDALARAEQLLLIDPLNRAAHLHAASACRALDQPEREVLHLWAVRDLAPQPGDPADDDTASRLAELYARLLAETRQDGG